MTIPDKTILYAATADMMDGAKEYIAHHKLTPDDVRLLIRGDMVVVECKREVTLATDPD